MSEKKVTTNQPVWRSNVDNGYFQMLNIYGGEENEEALIKAKSEFGFALQVFKKSPTLQKCGAESIINAIANIARTSLTLNPVMQLAYLIPRRNQCTLEISYRGMVKLLKDANAIHHIEAYMVFEDEEYSFDPATQTLVHVQKFAKTEDEHNKRVIHGCYTRAILPSGVISYSFMPYWELEKVRAESSSKEGMVWKKWRDEMYKKTVIKRHAKTLMTDQPSLLAAMEIDNENNGLTRLQTKSKISQALEVAAESVDVEFTEEIPFQNV
jgi:recombination protein RecT